MGMTFNKGTFYPSDSKKKKTKKKTGTDADYHKNMSDKEMDEMGKLFKPIFSKSDDDLKKDISIMQIEDALGRTKGSEKLSKKSLKKVIDAAADDKQLERSERRLMRMMKKGGKVIGCSLKAVPANKKGLKKLPTQVRNKMGYMKTGGRVGLKSGGAAKRGRGCEIR